MLQVGFGLIALVGLALYAISSGAPIDSAEAVIRLFEESQMTVQMVASVPMTAGVLGMVVLFRRYLDHQSIESLGFVRPGRSLGDSVAGGLLFGVGPIVLVIAIVIAAGGLRWTGVSASAQTLVLFPVLVALAFCEEIVCRGYLLQNLVDIGRPVWGIVFSSTVFWLLHTVNPAAWSSPIVPVNLFGAGVTLALARRASGNIWFPTAMHFGWNFAQGILFEAPISGLATDGLFDLQPVDTAPDWLTGGTFGVEGSVLTTVVELVLSAFFVRAARIREQRVVEPQSAPEVVAEA
jgi:hypothetical protein